MRTPSTSICYIVVCRDDDKVTGGKGDYMLATRQQFYTRDAAQGYAENIAHGREPIVVECPNGLTYEGS